MVIFSSLISNIDFIKIFFHPEIELNGNHPKVATVDVSTQTEEKIFLSMKNIDQEQIHKSVVQTAIAPVNNNFSLGNGPLPFKDTTQPV